MGGAIINVTWTIYGKHLLFLPIQHPFPCLVGTGCLYSARDLPFLHSQFMGCSFHWSLSPEPEVSPFPPGHSDWFRNGHLTHAIHWEPVLWFLPRLLGKRLPRGWGRGTNNSNKVAAAGGHLYHHRDKFLPQEWSQLQEMKSQIFLSAWNQPYEKLLPFFFFNTNQ